MDAEYIPKINCRFKVRQDLEGFLGFFQGKGVLVFNEIGAFIVQQMTGEKSLREIEYLVKTAFPNVESPFNEVAFITTQLQESGFLGEH